MKQFFILLAVFGVSSLSAQNLDSKKVHADFLTKKESTTLFSQVSSNDKTMLNSYFESKNGGFFVADDFKIEEDTYLTQITAYGLQESNNKTPIPFEKNLKSITSKFTVYIYTGDEISPFQDPHEALHTITLDSGSSFLKMTKTSELNQYTITLDLEAAGESIKLNANQHYWISIIPSITDNGDFPWMWYQGNTQNTLGKAQGIDPTNFLGKGYTYWLDLEEINRLENKSWTNLGMAFTLEGKKTLGSHEVIYDKSVSVYPNPVSSSFKIELTPGITVKSVNVHDLTGRQVVSTQGNVSEVNVQSLPKGTYVVTLDLSNGKSVTKKIVKK